MLVSEEEKSSKGMINTQYSASLRPLWTAVNPVASGSLPRTEGGSKLPFGLEMCFPRMLPLSLNAQFPRADCHFQAICHVSDQHVSVHPAGLLLHPSL